MRWRIASPRVVLFGTAFPTRCALQTSDPYQQNFIFDTTRVGNKHSTSAGCLKLLPTAADQPISIQIARSRSTDSPDRLFRPSQAGRSP